MNDKNIAQLSRQSMVKYLVVVNGAESHLFLQ